MVMYTGIIHKDSDSEYGIYFPDVVGCFSAGKDMDELMQMATKALAFHVDCLAEEGDEIPTPRPVEQILQEDVDVQEDMKTAVSVVQIPLLSRTAAKKRVEMKMDKNLLDAVDREAKALGITRTAFLQEAAQRMLFAKVS